MTSPPIPIVCDMTDAPDTTEERLAEYRRLFGSDLIGRERTENGIRFRFGVRDGLAAEIRDLAAREKACCAFFDFDIREHDDEITWDASVVDDPIARQILDEAVPAVDLPTEPAQSRALRGLDRSQVVLEPVELFEPGVPIRLQ